MVKKSHAPTQRFPGPRAGTSYVLAMMALMLMGGCATTPRRGSQLDSQDFNVVSAPERHSHVLTQSVIRVLAAESVGSAGDSSERKMSAGDHDVVEQIIGLQRPGKVGEWWAEGPVQHPEEWAGPLTEWELLYLASFGANSVPAALRIKPQVDPANLTQEESTEAVEMFGSGADAARLYANYASRRRIVRHYFWTHPATVRLLIAQYGLARDVNPLHFALERGWQIGSGKEMFTKEDRSRLGAAAEFLVAVAIMKGVKVGGDALRSSTALESTAAELISGKVVKVDPRTLRWSQSTAGGRGRADTLRASMGEKGWAGDPIDVVVTRDGLVTVDHTRAAVALELQIKEIPVRLHLPADPLPADMLSRPWNSAGQTATTWGQAIELRGAGQIPPIGPTGSPMAPRLPKPKDPKGK